MSHQATVIVQKADCFGNMVEAHGHVFTPARIQTNWLNGLDSRATGARLAGNAACLKLAVCSATWLAQTCPSCPARLQVASLALSPDR